MSSIPGKISLEEVHHSVSTSQTGLWRRLFAFAGPAYLVSVGYMDPGNWATDLEGGSRFGYALLCVLLVSNAMAVLLQTLSARLGIAGGKDLAQACRSEYPKPVAVFLWIVCEIAIVACDLAEVLGTILGLNLVFGLPLLWGCLVTLFDTFLLFAIQRFGIRKMEAFILSMISVMGISFLIEVVLAKPDAGSVVAGLLPSLPPGALFVALGMLGATVMPHNLYLHSALVQTRKISRFVDNKADACKFNLIDTVVALNLAFFVNAAILIVAACVFYQNGIVVTEIQQAHQLIAKLVGTNLAQLLFGIALIAAGQSSTLTGTLAGQIVMEGFINVRLRPWLRRLITRSLAVIPAVVVIVYMGDKGTYQLMILSQVVLSLQLPFAIVPLIHFTSDKVKMGAFRNKAWVAVLAWITAIAIIALNGQLVYDTLGNWVNGGLSSGIYVPLFIVIGLVVTMLGYISIAPFFSGHRGWKHEPTTNATHVISNIQAYKMKNIAVALDRGKSDAKVVSHAIRLAKLEDANLTLVHVVDTAQSQVYGQDMYDEHTRGDEAYLDEIAEEIRGMEMSVEILLLHGKPSAELIRYAQMHPIDLLVMGAHGHKIFGDVLFGETIDTVRHQLQIPVLVVR